MGSVTQRVREVKQPYGGYLRPKDFQVEVFNDGVELNAEENLHASLVGLAVDYLTRFVLSGNAETAFNISLLGANIIGEFNIAKSILKDMHVELDDKSISSACKLCGYDVCFRSSPLAYKPVQNINPDLNTIFNIRVMVNRSITFWKKYGPIIKDGFTMEGGYTHIITSGDGDFLTEDTLWDFKVSKRSLTSKQTLQVLIYYLMGQHSIHSEFTNIKKLGIFNPRLNKAYLMNISNIDSKVIEGVSSDIIGYSKKSSIRQDKQNVTATRFTSDTTENEWLIPDLVARYKVSRSKITSDFLGRGLPYYKVGRAYHFIPSDVIKWEIKQRYIPYGKNNHITLPAFIMYKNCLKEKARKAIERGDEQQIEMSMEQIKNESIPLSEFGDIVDLYKKYLKEKIKEARKLGDKDQVKMLIRQADHYNIFLFDPFDFDIFVKVLFVSLVAFLLLCFLNNAIIAILKTSN